MSLIILIILDSLRLTQAFRGDPQCKKILKFRVDVDSLQYTLIRQYKFGH